MSTNSFATKHSNPVLIIEDSSAVVMIVQEFLSSLGYYNIERASTAKEGMNMFENLPKSKDMPIVFLDYNLPDFNGNTVLSQITTRRPGTKVIIITGLDRTDEAIKEVISKGAYVYLQKPIRLADLKNTMQIIEEESYARQKKSSNDHKVIDSLLGSSLVSVRRISELSGVTEDNVVIYLKTLEEKGLAIPASDIKEISCNRCHSVLVGKLDEQSGSRYFCSNCLETFQRDDAKWIISKSYRAKVNFKISLNTPPRDQNNKTDFYVALSDHESSRR